MALPPDVIGQGGPQEEGANTGPPQAPGEGAGGPPNIRGGALPFLQRGPQASAPGPGDQSSTVSQVGNAIAILQAALPGAQVGTPLHTAILRAVQQLSRHTAQGQPTAGLQVTQIQDLLRNIMRNALLSRIMQNMQQGGGQGGPPGAMAQAPMPSTPFPGA